MKENAVVVKQQHLQPGFALKVKSLPGGEKIDACIQCGTCTGSCPASFTMDYTPRKIIAMVKAGMREEVLSCQAIWMCASCYSCTVRCPRGIALTELMYSLKNLAIKSGYAQKLAGPAFYKTFNSLVEKNGRINEGLFMTTYTLKTAPLKMVELAPLGIKMFLKRRLHFKVASIKDKEKFRKIISRLREAEI